jgi:hypothetical protein
VGVEFEDAWPQRLERGLQRRRGQSWEVVNLAMPGMNSVDEETQLVQEGMDYRPEVVLLGYVLNDSEDATAAESRRARDWLEERQAPPPLLVERSALVRLVTGRVRATLENRRRVTGYRSMYAPTTPGWLAAQRSLRHMGALCKERGVPFVVAIFPLLANPLDEGYPFAEIHGEVARAASEAGARVFDLLPAFHGLRWDVLVVNGAEDEHPNEVAHRIAADSLLKSLDEVVPREAALPAPVASPAPCPVAAR